MNFTNKEVLSLISDPALMGELKRDAKLKRELDKVAGQAKSASILASPALIGAIIGIARTKQKNAKAKGILKRRLEQLYPSNSKFSSLLRKLK